MEQHVPGTRKDKKVFVWALSTCMWCKKAKKFLEDNGVDYSYVFVDTLDEDERDKVLKDVEKYNSSVSFPTILVENRCIVGFDEKKLKEALGL
jgi:glutaredoxin-like protein NrdH